MKMSIDRMISKPFSARSLDLRYEKGDNRDTVLRVSRERYGRPRDEVEDKISRWTKQKYSDGGNRSHQPNHNKQTKNNKSKGKKSSKKNKNTNKNKTKNKKQGKNSTKKGKNNNSKKKNKKNTTKNKNRKK
jgi:hypothetical protein